MLSVLQWAIFFSIDWKFSTQSYARLWPDKRCINDFWSIWRKIPCTRLKAKFQVNDQQNNLFLQNITTNDRAKPLILAVFRLRLTPLSTFKGAQQFIRSFSKRKAQRNWSSCYSGCALRVFTLPLNTVFSQWYNRVACVNRIQFESWNDIYDWFLSELYNCKVETLNKQLRVQKPDDRTAIKPRFVWKQNRIR